MRRSVCVTALLVASIVSAVYAQKVTKAEEFHRAMQTIGAAVDAGTKAIDSGAHADAKVPLVLARQTLASTVPFWIDTKTNGAVKMTKDAVQKLDALDGALSNVTLNVAAVSGAVAALTDACRACHSSYREGDRDTGYRIK